MPKILCLAKSGFGKTTSFSGREKFGIKGLNPEETYVIQCIGRGLSNLNYKLITGELGVKNQALTDRSVITTGNRIQVDKYTGLDRFIVVAEVINTLKKSTTSPYKNIVIDDMNYLMQDYYMANAMKGGWDTPKQMGYGMGLIFESFRDFPENKNLICCAHYEEYKDKNGDSLSYRFKTVGKMVDDYIVPEGKFDIVLFGKVEWDAEQKKAVRHYVKEFDGEYPAKDSLGVLDDLPNEIPNDLSIIVEKLKEIYE